MQALSNGSGQTGGAAPTRSEDPEGIVLPEAQSPLTYHPKSPYYLVTGYLTTASASTEIAVEESLEVSSRNPEGSNRNISHYACRENRGESVQQEEQSEIAVKSVPEQRNIIKDPKGNPSENFYRSIRDLAEKSEDRTTGQTQVHHPRLSITEVTEQRIIGSLPGIGPASPLAGRQPQEEPIRVSRRSLNKVPQTRSMTFEIQWPVFNHGSYPQESSTKRNVPTSSTLHGASLRQFSPKGESETKEDKETATPVRHRPFTINAVTNPASSKLMN
ncbi:hypothetical protein EAF04_003288 [Stromatinia cepivora]|nr:hypothetical protein EAF04_003288 [Stromatinia cepivora]